MRSAPTCVLVTPLLISNPVWSPELACQLSAMSSGSTAVTVRFEGAAGTGVPGYPDGEPCDGGGEDPGCEPCDGDGDGEVPGPVFRECRVGDGWSESCCTAAAG